MRWVHWGEGHLEGGQKEREEIKGWGRQWQGNSEGVAEEAKEKEGNSGQCCGLCMLGWHFHPRFWRKKEMLGEKGKWVTDDHEVKTWSIVICYQSFTKCMTEPLWFVFKGRADRLCPVIKYNSMLSWMNVNQNKKAAFWNKASKTWNWNICSRNKVKPICRWRRTVIVS